MVTGVNGDLDHVVRYVVVEYETILECVTIPSHHVEERIVMDLLFIPPRENVMNFAVQVCMYVCMCVYM